MLPPQPDSSGYDEAASWRYGGHAVNWSPSLVASLWVITAQGGPRVYIGSGVKPRHNPGFWVKKQKRHNPLKHWTGGEDLLLLPRGYYPRYCCILCVLATPQDGILWVPGVQGIEEVGHEGDPICRSTGEELVGSPELSAQPKALKMGEPDGGYRCSWGRNPCESATPSSPNQGTA